MYFSGLGPPKHVPDAYVYKGDYAGCRKDAFGSEKCTFQASKRSKTGKQLLFVNLACKSTPVAAARKKYQYIIGCASVSGKCWITVFHEIYDFQCKSGEFFGNTWNFHIFLQNYRFPGPARPACARPYKTNAFSYIFVAFWRPRTEFPGSRVSGIIIFQ